MSFASVRYSEYSSFVSIISPGSNYWDTEIHSHTTEELLLLVSPGSCTIRSNGETFQVPTPAFIWNRAGSYHLVTGQSIVGEPSYTATFPTKLLTDTPKELQHFRFIQDNALFAIPLSDSRLQRLKALFSILINSPMAQRIPLLACIFHQISLYLKPDTEVYNSTGSNNYIFKVISTLEQPDNKSLTTQDLADQFHVCKSKLEKDFKRCTGRTIHNFRLLIQLQAARMQLLTTKKTLLQIAHECGFTDESHFIRTFRKEFGMTPGTCRRNYKNKPR